MANRADRGLVPQSRGKIRLVAADYIEIYLNDHWAGAGAGVAVARRLARHNRKTVWADRLRTLARDIEEDEHTFAAIRQAMGVSGGRFKRLLALVGERLSALKPNGGSFGYSPLSRILESEMMLAGVSAKHRLWVSLQACCREDPRLAGVDVERLEKRAEEQLELLRDFHRDAAGGLT